MLEMSLSANDILIPRYAHSFEHFQLHTSGFKLIKSRMTGGQQLPRYNFTKRSPEIHRKIGLFLIISLITQNNFYLENNQTIL